MPASDLLTMSTWVAWSSTDRLRCSTPTPPWRAIAIAIRASGTVSIALESNGVRRVIDLDSRVEVSTSLGMTSDAAGSSRTSSNVSPTVPNFAGRSASLLPTRLHPQSSGEKVSLRNDKDYGGNVRDDPPLDPPAAGPGDPASGSEDAGAAREPLTPQEREDIVADLEDLEVFQALLEPRGV